MDDFKPFLQIIHISDLHVSNPKSAEAVAVRGSIRKLRRFLPDAVIAAIEDGIAPHDRLAIGLFKEFLQKLTTQDKSWCDCKTWLVDTGDLTSLGDQDSLNLGMQFLNDLAKVCPDSAWIYGNHDAWPGKIPFWAASAEVASQKKALSKLKYNINSPKLALEAEVPNGAVVQLFALDSISHNRWNNLRAVGEISEEQLNDFASLVDQNYKSDQRQFRILAVHHPVHYPPPRPHFQCHCATIAGWQLFSIRRVKKELTRWRTW